MATIVTTEIDKHGDGRWEVYNRRATPGKGSNARKQAVTIAREVAKTTMDTVLVRVRSESDDDDSWLVWHSNWAAPRWRPVAGGN